MRTAAEISPKPYYFLAKRMGLREDGTLSRDRSQWRTFSAADVDAHLAAGIRPIGMKSGDFHVEGSYQYAITVRGDAA